MTANASGGAFRAAACVLALALLGPAGTPPVRAAANFPDVPVWVIAGAWRDSTQLSHLDSLRCPGSFAGPQPDSVDERARVVTVRFLRDRVTEARPDFGGYRIYRMTNSTDSSRALLVRRFSLNPGSDLTWNLSRVTKTSTISLLPGNGDGTFAARTEIASGVAPTGVVAAKINKDTRMDLGIVNQGSNSVSILAGVAGGSLFPLSQPETQAGPVALVFADANADTILDAFTANRDGNSVTANISSGPVAYIPTSYKTGARPSGVAIGDVTGDGLTDIVASIEGVDSISIFPRLGGLPLGRFGNRIDLGAGDQPAAVALADLNADAKPDVIVANRGSNTITVYLTLSGGLFTGPVTYPTGTGPWGLAVADVNADAKPDLAVANSGESSVSVFLGDGVGGFLPRSDLPSAAFPRSVALGDLNGDNKVDIVSASFTGGVVSRQMGDGTGSFGPRVDIPAGSNPAGVTIGDLNADGKADLAVANFAYDLPYKCQDQLTLSSLTVNDSIATYVDPDSAGRYIKVCRDPGLPTGRCNSPGDSIFILVAPPGPHDGFLTWYSVTIERRNTTDPDYEDLFLPDTLDNFARCTDPLDRLTCPNLNHKLRNLAGPVEPTAGPTANLERVLVVPNPYRGSEVWDQPGQGELHFINLPASAIIKIYTTAGDLVRELKHSDQVRDFERWDLKNASGRAVASGIYIYRIEAGSFHFQNRFVVIR
jgi:hypothetical protein